MPPGEDVGLREETLEAMATAVENIEHQASGHAESAEVPDFDNKRDSGHEAATPAFGSAEGKTAPDPKMPKLPRVDPPPVEDEPGQAIREDTPGYIAQAFPKLFPHGTGDFHCLRGGMSKLLKFEEWGADSCFSGMMAVSCDIPVSAIGCWTPC